MSEEALAKIAENDDKDAIDPNNIISGKRIRKKTVRYEDTVFNSEEYRKMMLCDVPDDELKAALEDEDFSDSDESREDGYDMDMDEGDDDDNDDEGDDEEYDDK